MQGIQASEPSDEGATLRLYQALNGAAQSGSSADPMYSGLPSYRFPAPAHMKLPSMFHTTTQTAPPRTLPRFGGGAKLPAAPASEISVNDSESDAMATSPTASSFPSSTFPSTPATFSTDVMPSSLQPALPILSFSEAPAPSHDPYPSGMVAHAPVQYHYNKEIQMYDSRDSGPSISMQNSTPPRIPLPHHLSPAQTPQRSSTYPQNGHLEVQYSPMSSPSTFYPSSAYLPSVSTFSGLAPDFQSFARSAPSTPQGTQDARFPSEKAWPQSALPNPFPAAPRVPDHRMLNSPQQPSGYAGYYSADDFERSSSPLSTPYRSHAPNSGSPYIPYARPPKSLGTPHKRSPTYPGDYNSVSPSPVKKAKKDAPVMFDSQSMGYMSDAALADLKAKQQRVKIACGACRKTRLRCDGGAPCTSCIEKHIKAYPSKSEAEAAEAVAASGSCTYENFVRRRGKGKKTLEKQAQRDTSQRASSHDNNGSSGSSDDGSTPSITPNVLLHQSSVQVVA